MKVPYLIYVSVCFFNYNLTVMIIIIIKILFFLNKICYNSLIDFSNQTCVQILIMNLIENYIVS